MNKDEGYEFDSKKDNLQIQESTLMHIGNGLQENLLNENDFIQKKSVEKKVVKKKKKRKDKNNYE